MSRWYYAKDGQTKGPLSFEELQALGDRAELGERDNVFEEGSTGWVPAATVPGLIRTGLVPPSPVVSPPSLPPLPEPEWDPRMTFRANAPTATTPVDAPMAIAAVPTAPLPPPPPSTPFGTILVRAFTSNIGTATVGEGEVPILQGAGILDRTVQRYLVWRRSVLWVAVVLTSFTAILGVITELVGIIKTEDAFAFFRQAPFNADMKISALAWLLFPITMLGLFVMPLTAVLAATNWARPRLSFKLLAWGTLVAFGLPLLVALVPLRWQLSIHFSNETGTNLTYMVLGFIGGLYLLITLLPIVTGLISGLVSAAVRFKLLVPSVVIPGWLLLLASALYGLVLYVFFITLNAFLTSSLMLLAVLLFALTPFVYVLYARVFVQPADSSTVARVTMAAWINMGMGIVSVLFLFLALMTTKFGEATVVSLGGGPALLSLWQIIQMVISFIGRSLFVTVVAFDLLIRFNLHSWGVTERFAGTPEAKEYGALMGQFGTSLQDKPV